MTEFVKTIPRFDPSQPIVSDCIYVLDGKTISEYAAKCVAEERAKHAAELRALRVQNEALSSDSITVGTLNQIQGRRINELESKHAALVNKLNHLAQECNGIEGLGSEAIAQRLWAMLGEEARK